MKTVVKLQKELTSMTFKIAELSDIDKVLELHYKYQVDSILEEDKKDGFVTTPFTKYS